MSNKIYAGLKGLTAKDRKKWEKDIINEHLTTKSELASMSDADLDEAFAADFLKDYYKGNRNIDIENMSMQEAIDFYNAQYDMEQSNLNPYTVEEKSIYESDEQKEFEESITYDKKDRIIDSMHDIFYDRLSDEEKQKSDFYKKLYTKQNEFGLFETDYSKLFNEEYIKDIEKVYDKANFKNDPNYYMQVDQHASEIRTLFEEDKNTAYNAFLAFDSKANAISPEYRRFKDSKKLGLNAGILTDIMSNYYSILDLEGEEEANRFLANTMQDRLANNQSLGAKYTEGLKGMGASAFSSMVALYGGFANIGYALSEKDDIEGLTGWQNFWNKVIDNDITRYAKDVMTYQTYDVDTINTLKKIGWDKGTIFKTVQDAQGDLSDMVFNKNFIPEMISQHGFTVASTLVSGGATMLLKGAGRVLGKGALKVTGKIAAKKTAEAAAKGTAKAVASANKAEKALNTTEKVYEWLRHVGDKVAGVFGAGLAGTSESLTNAIDSKDELLEKGEQDIYEHFNTLYNEEYSKAEETVNKTVLQKSYEKLALGEEMTDEEKEQMRSILLDGYNDKIVRDLTPQMEEAMEVLKREAIQAQNTNFAFNQTITGAINSTLKATLMHPSVQKMWGNILGKNAYKINESGNWLRKGWFYARHMLSELFGEGVEEAATELTNAFSQGWHGSDFEHYLANGNHDVGQDVVNNSWASSLLGGMQAAGQSLLSKETAYSFIAGAAGSIASTVNLNGVYDVVATAKDPNATKADVFKAASSILFRSSVVEGYREAKEALKDADLVKQSVDNLMADPENGKIHTSVATMATYVSEMDASTDSELDYRNSKLGATVAEINSLERIKEHNPRYYEKAISTLNYYKNLKEEDEGAKEAIEEYKNSGLANTNETDAEILKTINENADKLLKLREKVLQRKKVNERRYGIDADPDIIDALTYGDIAYDEYKGRINSMSSDIRNSYEAGVDDSIEKHASQNLDKQTIKHLVEHGGKQTTEKTIKELSDNLYDLEEKLKKLKQERNKAKGKDKKTFDLLIERTNKQIKDKDTALKNIKKSSEKVQNITDDTILSEDDIMNLSIEDRAIVMSENYYNNTSKKQKEVIDNLKTILKNGDSATGSDGDSYIKIQDSASLLKTQKLHHEIRQQGIKAITNYGRAIKHNSAVRLSENRIKRLDSVKDFKEFESILEGFLSSPKTAFMDRQNAEKFLKDNTNYKRWKAKDRLRKAYNTSLNRSFIKEKLTDRQEILGNTVIGQALADMEIDINNIDAITEVLLGDGPLLDINAYYAKLSEGRKDLPQIAFDDAMLKRFIERIKGIKEMDAKTEQIQKPIIPDDKVVNDPPPSTPEVKQELEVKAKVNEEIKQLKEEVIEDVEIDKFIEDSISSVFKTLENNTQKSKFTNMLVAIASTKGKDSKSQLLYKKVFNELLTHDLSSLGIDIQQEIVDKLSEGNEETSAILYDIIINLTSINNNSFKRDNNGKVIYNGIDVTNDFNRITTLVSQASRGTSSTDYLNFVISDILSDSDNETLIQANTTHNIDDYLRESAKNNPKAEVKFVLAKDLAVFASNTTYPIYIVIESSDGTIEVEGKKYQVIGVSSTPNLGVTLGLQARAKIQRDLSPLTEEELPWQFVTDEITNTPIVFKGFKVKNESPEHVQKYEGNGTKISVMLDNEGMSIETFISRMTQGDITTDESGVTTVTYKSPYGDRPTVSPTPLPSQKGKNRPYLSYVEQTGKNPEKDTQRYGESEIELFVEELMDMIIPGNRSFIDVLTSDSNDIYNTDVVGYAVSNYANMLLNYVKSTIKDFSDPSFINGHIKANSSGLKFIGIQEFDEELRNLNQSLNRLLYVKDYTFSITANNISNGEIEIGIRLSFGDSTIAYLPIGSCGVNKEGLISFYSTPTPNEDVRSFISDFMLNNDKTDMRRITKDPLVKYQIDFEDIENARKGLSLTEKPSSMPELQYWISRKKIEEAIKRGMLRTSKKTLGRQGYRVEVNNTIQGNPSKPAEVFTNIPQGEKAPILSEKPKTVFEKALDKLVEAYKVWDKKRKEGIETEGIRVTGRNYSSKTQINDVVAAVGNIYDSAIRDVINDNANADTLSSKYVNLSKEEAQKIINAVEGIREYLKLYPGNWKLDARNFLLSGQLAEKRNGFITEEGKNGKTELVTGSPDIVAYNDDGQVIIIDVKTYADTTLKLVEQSKVGWKGQTDDYSSLMTASTEAQVIGTFILPIKVSYSKNASVTEDGTILEGAFPTQLSGELNSLGGTLLLNLSTVEDSILTNEEKNQSKQCGVKTGGNTTPTTGGSKPKRPDLTSF